MRSVIWICPRCSSTRECEPGADPVPTCTNGHSSQPMALHHDELPEFMDLPEPVLIGGRRTPAGPLKYASMTAFVLVFASLLAWIWLGNWEWGPTAVTLLFGGIFLREGSLKEKNE